jgi:ABC-type phosphate transport system permease subunit
MAALSLTVFRNAGLPYQDVQNQAWAAALLLVILVSISNIVARLYVRRVQA